LFATAKYLCDVAAYGLSWYPIPKSRVKTQTLYSGRDDRVGMILIADWSWVIAEQSLRTLNLPNVNFGFLFLPFAMRVAPLFDLTDKFAIALLR
jgi:hypothetical protein